MVVPATDRPPTLARCLAALRSSVEPADELIVVETPSGTGPAGARNAGAKQARAGVVAFVDADVEVHPDALGRLHRAFAHDPQLVAVFGCYDDRPADPSPVSRFRNLLHHHVHASSPGPAETFWAGLGAIRRDAFLAVGGFDAVRYPQPAIEDVELGMRLRAGGGRITLDPAITGTHLKRWSLTGMVHTDFARRGVPWTRLRLETGRTAATLNLSLRHRLSALASLALVGSLVVRRPLCGLAALTALVALNAEFYGLLARQGGAPLVAAGVPLHVVHHLVAAASVPAGAVLHTTGSRR